MKMDWIEHVEWGASWAKLKKKKNRSGSRGRRGRVF